MNLHAQLVEKTLPIIKHYQNDLLVHDKNQMERYPNRPFIHFTGDTGTHMVTLFYLEDYPSRFEQVPYLFGQADRHHILDQLAVMVDAISRCNRMDMIIYSDGDDLYEISYETAKSKVAEYTRKMKTTFKTN